MSSKPISFIQRNLTIAEAKLLVKEIKTTPNITGYTELEWINFNKVIVCEVNNKFAGVCTISKISNQWYEIAVIYVLEQFRGIGIGTDLFKMANHILEGKSIYTSSRNPIIINLMRTTGYTIFDNLLKLPLVINIFNLKWILSLYRLKEGYRKKYLNKSMNGFVYGIKAG